MTHADLTPHRVYDPLLRLLHWTIALSVVVLAATSQLAEAFEHGPEETALWNIHLIGGYSLAAALLARLLWGLVGPRSARWRDLWHPATWRGLLRLHVPSTQRAGHDAVASLAYLAAYAVMAVMVVSGLGLAAVEFEAGPLAGWLAGTQGLEEVLEEPHEAGFALLLGFVGLHLAALVFHQLRGERVAQSMVTGKQYLGTEHGARHD
jgi:cytochrome b